MNKPNSLTPDDLKDLLNQPSNNQWPQSRKRGFRKIDDPEDKVCRDPAHNPPSHIVLQPGTYEYTCPSCGNVQVIKVPKITM